MPVNPSDASPPSCCPPPAADYQGLAKRLGLLRQEIVGRLGPEDLRHLRRIVRWGRLCTLVGYLMAPWCPNPLAAAGLSQGNVTRWLLMHHIGHRGYDKVPQVPARYTSAVFARGARRFIDWFDWMLPEAWRHEHNHLHHHHVGEAADPDLVEAHVTDSLLHAGPRAWRYLGVLFFALTWKLTYYAPNTFGALHAAGKLPLRAPPARQWWAYFNPLWQPGRLFWRRCVLPYGLVRFVLLPAAFLPLGGRAWLWVLCNSLLAEALTNATTFLLIAPNHAGDDVYRFEQQGKDRVEYYARQILGSVNYRCGSDRLDFAQMWLNYQIEHHIWPDLPMRQYQRCQPEVRALCRAHHLPYVQQSVWRRLGKLVDIMVGRRKMRRIARASALPTRPAATRSAGRGAAPMPSSLGL